MDHGSYFDMETGTVFFDFQYYWNDDDKSQDKRQTIKVLFGESAYGRRILVFRIVDPICISRAGEPARVCGRLKKFRL